MVYIYVQLKGEGEVGEIISGHLRMYTYTTMMGKRPFKKSQ